MSELARLVAISGGIKKPGGGKWELSDFCAWGAPPEPVTLGPDAAFAMFAAFAKPKET